MRRRSPESGQEKSQQSCRSLERGDQDKRRTGVFQHVYKHPVEYHEELCTFT